MKVFISCREVRVLHVNWLLPFTKSPITKSQSKTFDFSLLHPDVARTSNSPEAALHASVKSGKISTSHCLVCEFCQCVWLPSSSYCCFSFDRDSHVATPRQRYQYLILHMLSLKLQANHLIPTLSLTFSKVVPAVAGGTDSTFHFCLFLGAPTRLNRLDSLAKWELYAFKESPASISAMHLVADKIDSRWEGALQNTRGSKVKAGISPPPEVIIESLYLSAALSTPHRHRVLW